MQCVLALEGPQCTELRLQYENQCTRPNGAVLAESPKGASTAARADRQKQRRSASPPEYVVLAKGSPPLANGAPSCRRRYGPIVSKAACQAAWTTLWPDYTFFDRSTASDFDSFRLMNYRGCSKSKNPYSPGSGWVYFINLMGDYTNRRRRSTDISQKSAICATHACTGVDPVDTSTWSSAPYCSAMSAKSYLGSARMSTPEGTHR